MTEPPAAKGVTPSKVRYRPLSRSRNPLGWKVIALSIAGSVVGGAALVVFAGKSAQDEMEAQGHFDRTITIDPEHSRVCWSVINPSKDKPVEVTIKFSS